MDKLKKFNTICRDISALKIQGARSVARAALEAYSLVPTEASRKKLLSLRPTEPMLVNVIHRAKHTDKKNIVQHFDEAQEKINRFVFGIVKNGDRIFLHCHSTNVINALIYTKKHGKKFQVYNTETRPLFQGRKTASNLTKAGIHVTTFVDSAAALVIEKNSRNDKIYSNIVLFGADAILEDGAINKIGSGMFAEIANKNRVPVYIVSDSWKYSPHHLKIEERDFHEVWKKVPKYIKIKNPAFEKIPKKYIRAIVSELGILKYDKFLRKVKNLKI